MGAPTASSRSAPSEESKQRAEAAQVESITWAAVAEQSSAEVQSVSAGAFFPLQDLLDKALCRARGIPPAEREQFLSEEEFRSVFGMDKAAFAKLAKFKRDRMKKE